MKYLRLLVIRALGALLHYFVLFRVKASGYRRLQIGRCRFYGPRRFIEMCQRAMGDLCTVDSTIYNEIASRRYLFWFDKTRLDFFAKHYAINDTYCDWGPKGIMTFLVHVYYRSTGIDQRVFPLFNHSEINRAQWLTCENTRTWLLRHNFPAELVESFESCVTRAA